MVGKLAESISYDGGLTWDTARLTDIDSADTRIFISRTPSGRIILINNDDEKIRNELDILVSDLLGYLQPEPEPEAEQEIEEYISPSQAIEEIEIEAIVPEPAMESLENPVQPIETAGVESSQKGFTLLIKGGALTAFDGVWSPEFGIGLDFSRMAAMGDAASFGLRSDISVNLFPVLTKMAGVYDGMLLIASIPSCSVLGSGCVVRACQSAIKK